jgi:hypothetical protein
VIELHWLGPSIVTLFIDATAAEKKPEAIVTTRSR